MGEVLTQLEQKFERDQRILFPIPESKVHIY